MMGGEGRFGIYLLGLLIFDADGLDAVQGTVANVLELESL